jgi:hypothetical protein
MRSQGGIAVLAAMLAIAGAWGIALAQSGAPGPGGIQTPGGGWVPPGHPLASPPPHPHPGTFVCGNHTVRGTYGIQMQGTRPVPPAAGGGIETVIGVVLRTYDGFGSFTQLDNVKGSVTGIQLDRPGFGTYQVHADCTGASQFDPGVGILIEERLVIVGGGREIRSITATPPPIMVSSVQQRIER